LKRRENEEQVRKFTRIILEEDPTKVSDDKSINSKLKVEVNSIDDCEKRITTFKRRLNPVKKEKEQSIIKEIC